MFSNKPSKRILHFVENDDNNIPILTLREDENEYIIKQYIDIELGFNNKECHGNGDLYVTSLRIVWLSKTINKASFEFDVPYIMLHAISKDISTYPKPCIYCQLDEEYIEVECNGDGELDSDGDAEPTECFFAPAANTTTTTIDEDFDLLMNIFESFSETAQLNPDPDEDEGQDDGMIQYSTDDFIFNQEEVSAGAQQAQLDEWDKKLINNTDTNNTNTNTNINTVFNQFQDANESEVGNGANTNANADVDGDEHTGKYIKTA